MLEESDTDCSVRSDNNPPVKINLEQTAFKGRIRNYRVILDNSTTYDFLERVREQVVKLMVDVLKELTSYKVYFVLETRYFLNHYGDKFKSFQTKPTYLARESNVQEVYEDVSRNFKRRIRKLDATGSATVVYMDIVFSKCTLG